MAVPLTRVNAIPPEVTETLARNGFQTTKDLLSLSAFEVREICWTLPTETVALAMLMAARSATPKKRTALQLYSLGSAVTRGAAYPTRISTGLADVDEVLLGGLRHGTLSEIVGPNGVGKTQLVLQLCAMAGQHGHVLYFDAENAFNAQRLLEIASLRFPETYASTAALEDLSKRTHVFAVTSARELGAKLGELENFIAINGVRLIVVDSVAALVRRDFGIGGGHDSDGRQGGNAAQISDLLSAEASKMKYLAEHYNLAVVATNHVTTTSVRQSDERMVTAALGNTWHHATNMRIVLEYLVANADLSTTGQNRAIRTAGDTMVEGRPTTRVLRIAKSSVAAAASFPYVIDGAGLRLLATPQ
ncbi:P-loop containing nucleoside triphosphate hydrolase protein [Hyaloraphidium curvatum]|nr:P-loop containing nucleoside triphosphate hydrolase protein [Hyaloraphidium curvatum]